MKYAALILLASCGVQSVDVGDATDFPVLVEEGYYYHIFLVDRDEARSTCASSPIGREQTLVYRGVYEDRYGGKAHHADMRGIGWKSADSLDYEASWNFFEPRVYGNLNIYPTPLGLEGSIYLNNYECHVHYQVVGILKDVSTFSEDDH